MTVRGFTEAQAASHSRTRVKICGVRDVGTAAVCAEAGADFFGLVFVDRSPRFVEPAAAAAVTRALHAFGLHAPVPVGLFCDHAVEDVLATAAEAGLTTLQLHGSETPADVATLADAGLTVWKAIGFSVEGVDSWRDARGLAALLVDAPPPTGAGITGGHGEAFNWDALAAIDRAGLPPLWLAGGLTPENVAEAIGIVRPFGVDVSSGVEAAKGVKDADKVRRFVTAARSVGA